MQKHADNYAQGLSESTSEVPEPMRILMKENSQALDAITRTARDSRSRKPSED
jgi:hypothetical protein